MNGTGIRVCATLLVVGAFVNSVAGQAQPPATVQHLWTQKPEIKIARFYTVFMYAFEQNAATATEADMRRIVRQFDIDLQQLGGPGNEFNFSVATPASGLDPRITSKVQMDAHIAALRSMLKVDGTDNVVFVYLLSHGEKLPNGRIQLKVGKDPIDRDSDLEQPLKQLLTGRQARLVVLVTDNCSQVVGGHGSATSSAGGVWRALYFGHTGFVSIESSNREDGELALCAPGSVFVHAFGNALRFASMRDVLTAAEFETFDELGGREKAEAFVRALDRFGEADELTSWDEFRRHLETQMAKRVKEVGQGNQNVVVDTSEVQLRSSDPGR